MKRGRNENAARGASKVCSFVAGGQTSGPEKWKADLNSSDGSVKIAKWEWSETICCCVPPDGWTEIPHRFIDTHCHLESLDGCKTLPPLRGNYGWDGWWERSSEDAVICAKHVLDCQPAAVAAIVTNCCDVTDFAWYEGLMAAWDSGEYQDKRIYWTVGVHPCCAAAFETRDAIDPEVKQRMMTLAAHPRCVAIGECGLDYCKSSESHEAQVRVFERMCQLAVRLQKTLVLHARDAPKDTIRILRANIPSDWPIHLHGYTGLPNDVEELLTSYSNLCIGFGGAITIKEFHGSCGHCAPLWLPSCRFCGGQNDWVLRDLDALIRSVPLDRLLLETDAPFIAPRPFGMQVGQPWMLAVTAEHIAAKKGVTAAEAIEASNRNAQRLYNITI